MISRRWIISHRCSWITVYVLCCNAQMNLIVIFMTCICIVMHSVFVNCPTVIYSPSMLFIFRDFYFRALGSLVVLSFPQLLSFSSVLSKPLSETVTSAGTVMSTHFYSCRHLLGLQVQMFVEQQQVSLKWNTQGLSNSGRKRSKLSLSNNPAIMIQKVSCVPNIPNTLVKCIGALVRRRDSEI
jgi:hypothetical protein